MDWDQLLQCWWIMQLNGFDGLIKSIDVIDCDDALVG